MEAIHERLASNSPLLINRAPYRERRSFKRNKKEPLQRRRSWHYQCLAQHNVRPLAEGDLSAVCTVVVVPLEDFHDVFFMGVLQPVESVLIQRVELRRHIGLQVCHAADHLLRQACPLAIFILPLFFTYGLFYLMTYSTSGIRPGFPLLV